MGYWEDRAIETQEKLTTKSIEETEKQLRKYYKKTSSQLVKDFEFTYTKLYNTVIRDNHEPTPADLYKLDAYWQLQGQITNELQRLGDRQAALFRIQFIKQYVNVYNQLPLGENAGFARTDAETALQMINHIWCADGKSWSDRVWTNTNKLQQALNDGLIECVLGGKDDKYLRQRLMNEFNVSYHNADSIVKTELAHIQTQAAKQRYIDAGFKRLEVWARDDERMCDICGGHHEEIVDLWDDSKMPPFHPRCRCCVLPVIE